MAHHHHARPPLHRKSHGNVLQCDNLPYLLLHPTTHHQLLHPQRTRRIRPPRRRPSRRSLNHPLQLNHHQSWKTPRKIHDWSANLGKNYFRLLNGNHLYMLQSIRNWCVLARINALQPCVILLYYSQNHHQNGKISLQFQWLHQKTNHLMIFLYLMNFSIWMTQNSLLLFKLLHKLSKLVTIV